MVTGQAGIYGRLDPRSGEMRVWDAPKGRGPYGIYHYADGAVYFASLAGSCIARIDTRTGAPTVIEPPTPDQGARRLWANSKGGVWVSEWSAGPIARFDPSTGRWQSWRIPGDSPRPYAIYVDEHDIVWLSDFGANTHPELRTDRRSIHDPRKSQAPRQRLADRRPSGRGLGAQSRAPTIWCGLDPEPANETLGRPERQVGIPFASFLYRSNLDPKVGLAPKPPSRS